MDRLLKLADANTRIVPGFGPVMMRAQLQVERDVMKDDLRPHGRSRAGG
jgi:hypothetical protein